MYHIQKNARETALQIEATTEYILQRTQAAVDQYDYTLQQLQEINTTINTLTVMINSVRREMDKQLNWIMGTVGGGGELKLFHFQ